MGVDGVVPASRHKDLKNSLEGKKIYNPLHNGYKVSFPLFSSLFWNPEQSIFKNLGRTVAIMSYQRTNL